MIGLLAREGGAIVTQTPPAQLRPSPDFVSRFNQLFIGGCPRSGTTLLARMLMGVEGSVVPPESHFKEALLSEDLNEEITHEEVALLHDHWQRRAWDLPPFDTWPWKSQTRAEFLEWLVRQHGNKSDEEVTWIDHTPSNITHSSALASLFPTARFLHIVRDPRGVYSSVRSLDWGPCTPCSSARWWLTRLESGLEAEAHLAERCLQISFEQLLSHTDKTLSEITQWMDLSVPLKESGPYPVPSYSQRQHSLVNEAIDPRRATAWEHELSARDREIIESSCSVRLDALGYKRQFSTPRAATPLEKARDAGVEFWQQGLVRRVRRHVRRRLY
jgi:hypothetical protein